MIRVGFFGTVGSGKDALAHSLSTILQAHAPVRGKRCKVRPIQEYSVWWTDRTGGTDEVFEQFYIWYKQRQWDHDFDNRNSDPLTVVVGAAPAPLAYFYALYFADPLRNPKHRMLIEDLYGKAMGEMSKYDLIFYLPVEFSVPEGNRLRKRELRLAIDRSISAFLEMHKIPFIELSGSLERRAKVAASAVKRLLKSQIETNKKKA